MTDFEQLSPKLQKLCKPRTGKDGHELSQDLTINCKTELFFLTNVFKDGSFLGFWSHSPWGTCHDKEQGWCILSPELEILDTCETLTDGQPAGNDFREWRKNLTEEHGKSFKLKAEWETEQFWKITDC